MGHKVFQAADGKTAIVLLSKESLDVLITDINLPDMSGTAVASAAKQIAPTLHIIFASGDTNFPAPLNSVLLRKPYDEVALTAALKRVI